MSQAPAVSVASGAKTFAITGASSGLGLATAVGLAKLGARLVLLCRDRQRAAAAARLAQAAGAADVTTVQIDLASIASIQAGVNQLEREVEKLDALVNNAAVWPAQRRQTLDGFELALGVNHLGHALLTRGVAPLLRRAKGRVVVVASGLHVRGEMNWDDLNFASGGFSPERAYAQSKLANILWANELARREPSLTVNSLHPGVCNTSLARELPHLAAAARRGLSPEHGAKTAIHLASSAAVARVTGRYFDQMQQRKPSSAASDVVQAKRLWDWTHAQLSNLS